MKQYLLFWMAMAMSLLLKAQTEPIVTLGECVYFPQFDTGKNPFQTKGISPNEYIFNQNALKILGSYDYIENSTISYTFKRFNDTIQIIKNVITDPNDFFYCVKNYTIEIPDCDKDRYIIYYMNQDQTITKIDTVIRPTIYTNSGITNWCDSTRQFKFVIPTANDNDTYTFYTNQTTTDELTDKIEKTSKNNNKYITVPASEVNLNNDTASIWVKTKEVSHTVYNNQYGWNKDTIKNKFIKLIVYNTIRLTEIEEADSRNELTYPLHLYADSLSATNVHIPKLGKILSQSTNWEKTVYDEFSKTINIIHRGQKFDVELTGSAQGTIYWIDFEFYSSIGGEQIKRTQVINVLPLSSPKINFTIQSTSQRMKLISVRNCNCKMPTDPKINSTRFNNQACKNMSLYLKTNKQDNDSLFEFEWKMQSKYVTLCIGCPTVSYNTIRRSTNTSIDSLLTASIDRNEYLNPTIYLTVKAKNCPDLDYYKTATTTFGFSSDTLPNAPQVRDTSVVLGSAAKIGARGTLLKWYTAADFYKHNSQSLYYWPLPAGSRVDSLTINTKTATTTDYYVTQTNGTCESEPAKMMVRVVDKPSVAYSQNAEECNDNKANYSILYLKNAVQIEGFTRTNSCFIPKTTVVTSVDGDITTIHITKTDTVSDLCKCTSLRRFKVYVPGSFNKVRVIVDNYYNDALDTTVSKPEFTSNILPWCDAVSKNVPFNFTASNTSLTDYRAFNSEQSNTAIDDLNIKILSKDMVTKYYYFSLLGLVLNNAQSPVKPQTEFLIPNSSLQTNNDTTNIWVAAMAILNSTNKITEYSNQISPLPADSAIQIKVYNTIKLVAVGITPGIYTVYADTIINGQHRPNKNAICFKGQYSQWMCDPIACPPTFEYEISKPLIGSLDGTIYWFSSSRKETIDLQKKLTSSDNSISFVQNPIGISLLYNRIIDGERIKLSAVKDCQKCNAKPDSVTLTLKDKSINIICKPKAYCLKSNAQKNDFVYNWEFDSKTSSYNSSFQKDSSFERSAKIDSVILSNKDGKENYQIIALTVKSATCNNSEYARSANYMVSYSKDTLPNPPMVSDKTITQNAVEYVSVTAEGKNLRWYEKLGISSFIAHDTISVSAAQIVTKTYFVTQTNGTCESEPAKMMVRVVAADDSVIKTSGQGYELEYSKKGGACGTSKEKLSYIYGDNSLTIQGYILTNSCAIPQTDVAIIKVGNLSTVHITQKDTAKNPCKCFGPRWLKLTLTGSFDTTRIIKDEFYGAAIDTTITRIGLPVAPQVTNIFVELGKTARLAVNDSAQNKGTVNWFADQAMQTQLGTGNTYQFTPTQLGLQWLYCNRKSIIGTSASTAVRVVVYAKNKDSIVVTPSNIATYNGLTYDLQHDTLIVEGLIASCSKSIPTLIVRQQDTSVYFDQYHGQCTSNQTTQYYRFIVRIPDCNKDKYHLHFNATDGVLQETGANTRITVLRTASLFGLDAHGVHNVDTSISIPLASTFEYAINQEIGFSKLRETNPGLIQELSVLVYKNNPGPVDGIHIHQYQAVKAGIDTIVYQSTNSKTSFRLIVHVRDTATSISGLASYNNTAFTQGTVLFFEKIGSGYVCMAQSHTTSSGAFTASKLDKATYLLLLIPDQDAKQYLPTYYINANRWEDARQINLIGRLENMHLPVQSYQPMDKGTGSIIGTVRFDNNILIVTKAKAAASNIVPVFVMQNGTIVAYALTDENGNYQINNLPDGAYDVYVEIPGYQHSAQKITIANGTSVTANFNAKDGVITDETISKDITLLTISPNPAANSLNIQSASAIHLVEVCSVTGQTLLRVHGNTSNIDLSSLSSGMYLVRVQTETETSTHNIVKQ